MVDAPALNTDLRDNLEELDLHSHGGGGSGSGTAVLGGTAGLTVAYFADAATPAAPTGTLTSIFTSGSMLGWRGSGLAASFATVDTHTHGY